MLAKKRLPDQLDVAFGPQAIISRFILQGDREARERGVYLSLEHDFEALTAFNKSQSETWFPLIPVFDPAYSDLGPGNAFWIAGRNHHGDLVAVQCARLFGRAALRLWSSATWSGKPSICAVARRLPRLSSENSCLLGPIVRSPRSRDVTPR